VTDLILLSKIQIIWGVVDCAVDGEPDDASPYISCQLTIVGFVRNGLENGHSKFIHSSITVLPDNPTVLSVCRQTRKGKISFCRNRRRSTGPTVTVFSVFLEEARPGNQSICRFYQASNLWAASWLFLRRLFCESPVISRFFLLGF
jgi:hypothetical protein